MTGEEGLMTDGCAIFIGNNPLNRKTNPFGKDIANRGLFRAMVEYGAGDDQLFLVHDQGQDSVLAANLFDGAPAPKPITSTSVLNHREIAARGTLFRGQANIGELAWLRRPHDDRAYSVVGLIHSLAPQAMRAYTAEVVSAPVEPWDALICTSPSVQRHLRALLEETADFLAARLAEASPGSGAPRRAPLPELPVIPLGVDSAAFAGRGAPEHRPAARAAFAVDDEAFVMLWVGRLSFFEKAYPQAMFAAAEETALRTGRKIVFLMAGWFPQGERGRALWQATAGLYAPSVSVRFLDGNDPAVTARVWAAADVFVSLVDNIQETFGITPLEAMAAGLPAVVSDWDGYRFTVRHGVTGFRVPTLSAPPGAGLMMANRHAVGMDSYQFYGAQIAAHVAVNVRAAADALTALAGDDDLRARMRAAALDHARASFDWSVVIAQYTALFEELAAIRAAAGPHEARPATAVNPVRNDPFAAFEGFASAALSDRTRLRAPAASASLGSEAHHDAELNRLTKAWRLPVDVTERVRMMLADAGETTVGELAGALGDLPPDHLHRHLVWMCKLGMLDWASDEPDEIDRVESGPVRPTGRK